VASGVQRVSAAGSWWRQTPHGTDPLWLASPPSSGRWQRGATIAAIYLADEEPTAWAEWYRVLAEIALPPTHGMPRDLWRWTIAVNDIADLSTPAKLARLDLPIPRARPANLAAIPSRRRGPAPQGIPRRALPQRRPTRPPSALPIPQEHPHPRRRPGTPTNHLPRPARTPHRTAHLESQERQVEWTLLRVLAYHGRQKGKGKVCR
jgi:hypothetical protein